LNTTSPFTIYDAAAGSGKTFTLVKEYLKILLKAKQDGYYKYILAITFTNKAVAEMKQRIIESLMSFTEDDFVENPSDMATIISTEIEMSLEEIKQKSKNIIKHLLHNYSSFSVETIDSFNHRLIRTFARDLKLSGNFEVSLDIDTILAEAVDLLISKAGEDPKITKTLIDYTLEKTDDDKSWDISKDIATTAKIIFNENDAEHLKKLKNKSFDDFLDFKKQLHIKHKKVTLKIIKIAKNTLQLIDEAELEFKDFNRSYFPKHFQNLANGKFDIKFNNKWQLAIGEVPLYTAGTLKKSPEIAATIDELTPTFEANFIETKKLAYKKLLIKAYLKSITPLSVINSVNQQIEAIKLDQNMVPISEFNQLINSEIKDQPTPFIYERLGERYRHFFIDEFQDTSALQWKNIMPLIENSITQEYHDGQKGSVMLVGDAKQSIYRWRGGLPEQFIELCNKKEAFQIKQKVENLPINFRSKKEIVNFNNEFFTFVSNYFSDVSHQEIYKKGNQQKHNNKEGGYVKFEFLEYKNVEESHEIYAEKVSETISHLLNNGFQEKDICILTRKKKDGIEIGSHLQENGITIVSSETLLLNHSPVVNFLMNCLTLSLFSNNDEVTVLVLEFLHQHLSIKDKKHTYLAALLKEKALDTYLKEKFDFSFTEMQSLSLYNSLEYCIRKFNINDNADAYLYGIMDMLYEFEQQPKASKIAFLEEWELKKEKASIPISDEVNGVQLMTIHKAKGLEFPVVIFPYADLDIYEDRFPKNWFPVNEEGVNFDETLINSSLSSIKEFGEKGKEIYEQQRSILELDNLNVLYVTLTRAEQQLFIFSKTPSEVKDEIKNYNQFFSAFLKSKNLWDENKNIFEIGVFQKNSTNKPTSESKSLNPYYFSSPPEDHQLIVATKDALLWESDKEKAIYSGTLLHDTMEKILQIEDMVSVFEELELHSNVVSEEKEELKTIIKFIVNHPELKRYYSNSDKIMVEQKIITSEGNVLIPDRLNFHDDNSVSIIDYKTGVINNKHETQINRYGFALTEMGFTVSEKILIYSSSEGIVINKV